MRRLMRFSLKTLLVVMTVLAVWLGLHVRGARIQKEAVRLIQEQHGWVGYDYQFIDGEFDPSALSIVPKWLTDSLGVDFFHAVEEVSFFTRNVGGALEINGRQDELPLEELLAGVRHIKCLRVWGQQVTDDNLQAVADLKNLESLVIYGALQITDRGIERFDQLKRLRWLVLTKSQITDKALCEFSRLPKLEVLHLESRHISNEGMLCLANHQRLEKLYVEGMVTAPNSVGDEGIMHLCRIPTLALLDVTNSRVTTQGKNAFMAERPNCKVQP